MGRVLTASFEFNGYSYTAVVVVKATGDGFSFSVSIPDESLHHLLPDGKFSYDTVNGVNTITILPLNGPAQELVTCIIRTIDMHL